MTSTTPDSQEKREITESEVDAFEDFPLTRSEYITTLTHFYRGERGRTDAWRARLDPTTNWAVVTTGGMLSFAFNRADHSHVTLLLANLLVTIFLCFEARRFRYFDVWRTRVRMIEENFFLPILRRDLISPRSDWRESVAQDLDRPKFKLTFLEAVAIRLRFNYLAIFAVILVAWLAKLGQHPTAAPSVVVMIERMAIGPLPGWVVLLMVTAFYGYACWLAIWERARQGSQDEVYGLDEDVEQWKR